MNSNVNVSGFSDRFYPPTSLVDTAFLRKDDALVSVHALYGDKDCFKDEEIIKICELSLPAPQSEEEEKECTIAKTKRGGAVLQQQATRGCTRACVEMLKHSCGKSINWKKMRLCNLGDTKSMELELKKSGLKPLIKSVPFAQIQQAIQKDGSAIVSIMSPTIGSHVVVLDKIDDKKNRAYIREPYHGWAIAVKLDVFRGVVGDGKTELIQVQAKVQ